MKKTKEKKKGCLIFAAIIAGIIGLFAVIGSLGSDNEAVSEETTTTTSAVSEQQWYNEVEYSEEETSTSEALAEENELSTEVEFKEETDLLRAFGKAVAVMPEMRMVTTASGKSVLPELPERLGERLAPSASLAFHPQVLGLKRGPFFIEIQRTLAIGRPVMHKPAPREIIHMSMFARHKKTHRHGVNGTAMSLRTIGVNESGPLGSVEVLPDVEEPRIVFGHQSALNAAEPTGKRLNRYADIRTRIIRVVDFLLANRRLEHPFDLSPTHPADLLEQSWLLDGMAQILFPRIKPHRHHRKVRQVNHRARTVCPKQLARANVSDSTRITHDYSPSSPFSLPLF